MCTWRRETLGQGYCVSLHSRVAKASHSDGMHSWMLLLYNIGMNRVTNHVV